MSRRFLAVLATAVTVAVGASPAAADSSGIGFREIGPGLLDTGQGPVLAGDEVLIGRTRDRRGVVEAVRLDGSSRRVLSVPDAGTSVGNLAASDRAVAIATETVRFLQAGAARSDGAVFGPLQGPLRPFPFTPSDVGVAGSLVVADDGDFARPVLRVWDIDAPGAPSREIKLPENSFLLGAAGHFAAILTGPPERQYVAVEDLLTGGRIYRVRTPEFREAAVAPDGRVAIVERDARGTHIVMAAPGGTRSELVRLKLSHDRIAASDSGIAAVLRAPRRLAQLVLVGYDGTVRPITPPLNDIDALDLEGDTVAFTGGRCVFAGVVPQGPPGAAPRDPCFGEPAELSFRRLDRIRQRGGRQVRVPLTCTVPPRNRCSVHLRLRGPGFTVHKRTSIRPGRHIVKVRIPAAHRRAAWRKGMELVTLEHGRATAGAGIP